MTTQPADPDTQWCVVADVGDETLLDDATRLEEVLLTIARWEDGDSEWTPPGPLAGRAALAALNRIQETRKARPRKERRTEKTS